MGEITTRPAPQPLPPAWARAVANSAAAEFARPKPHAPYGWDKADELREWHPTGRPAGHTLKTTSTVPKTPLLDSTELLSRTYFLAGTVSPDEYADLGVPALAWHVTQPESVGAVLQSFPTELLGKVDAALSLRHILGTLAEERRTAQLFKRNRNRHGTLVLRRNETVDHLTCAAWEALAHGATVVTLDAAGYWDWMAAADQLDAAELFRVLEQGGP